MTPEIEDEIKQLRKAGFTYRQISNRTGVNRGSISKLLNQPKPKGFDDWGRDKGLLESGKIKQAVGWKGAR